MTYALRSLGQRLKRFSADQSGTTLVEFAIVISVFLLILFAILDFGRLGYHWVSSEKAMQRAVRIAAVRPPVCADVPLFHTAGTGIYEAGTLCREASNVCVNAPQRFCTLATPDTESDDAVAAASEIWTSIRDLMPPDTDEGNVRLTYTYDNQLGFFGGPYVPRITATLVGSSTDGSTQPLTFTFMTPLSALAATAGAANASDIPGSIPFPDIKATLPAEDMNIGSKG